MAYNGHKRTADFSLLVRQIRPYDTEFKKQKFTFSEIANELGWSEGGKYSQMPYGMFAKTGEYMLFGIVHHMILIK